MGAIVNTLDDVRGSKNGLPKCVILNTVKGKGVSFMEDIVEWHGKAPNDEQFEQAIKEVERGLN